MKYTKYISLKKEEVEWLNKVLTEEPKSADECFGEDLKWTKSTTFPNGIVMYIDLCGVQYEEGTESNLPYTQATLNSAFGRELAFSEPGDDFLGEWTFEYGDNTYTVIVVEEQVCIGALTWTNESKRTIQDLIDILQPYANEKVSVLGTGNTYVYVTPHGILLDDSEL